MADISTIRVSAPSLETEIIGELDESNALALFRGIPYATVTSRWTHSKCQHSLGSVFTATHFGPRCNQGNGMVLVSGGTNDPVPGDDEFRCLNLNIAVPTEALNQGSQPLPVMVWIHGGGFAFGANSVARYRPQRFVSEARKFSTPVVLVQINYRLGPLGFAASTDLAVEVDGGSKAQPIGNYGLIDQRNALEWVNQYIGDFGGDPTNVTVFGVSAGSISIHNHLLAGHDLFDRAIMMSGAAPAVSPLRMEFYEEEWDRLCKRAGANGSTSEERLAHLRSLNVSDILKHSSPAVMGPAADGKLLPGDWHFEDNVSNARCKAIILGDTNIEALIFDGLIADLPQERFHQLVDAFFSKQDAEQLYAHFGFSHQTQSPEEFRDAFRLLLGSTLFHYPNVGIAKASCHSNAWRDNVFLYHWEEPSPFVGPTQGLSYHGLCALLVHMNEWTNCPPATQRVSLEAARIWTAFAHGKQPWEPYSTRGKFMRFGPNGQTGLCTFSDDTTRDYGFQEWLVSGFGEVRRFVRELMVILENKVV